MKIYVGFIFLCLTSLYECQQVQNAKCNYYNCPYLQGVCSNNECICAKHYMTVKDKSNKEQIFCNYETKSKFTAFFLEFLFPLGIGHFYANNYGKGILKFALFALLLSSCCFELCCLKAMINKGIVCLSFLVFVVLCSWIALQVMDLVGYLFGFYTDGFDFKMY